jgi:hypothetical protein
MLRRFLILVLALVPASAMAGVRATYTAPMSAPMVVEIADNGDIEAELYGGQRLVVIANHAFIVEDRLTGPLVNRLEDLAALRAATSRGQAATPAAHAPMTVQRGIAEVNGRSGQAWFLAGATGRQAEEPVAVISGDPALSVLGGAMQRVFAAQTLLGAIDGGWPPEVASGEEELLALLDHGAPLRFGHHKLSTVEQIAIDPATFA